MATTTTPRTSPGPWATVRWLARHRSVQVTAALWLAGNAVVLLLAGRTLPFDWPALPGSAVDQLVGADVAMLSVLALMALTCLLTRRRVRPDVAARAPDVATARRETVLLLAWAALGLLGGFVLGRLLGWHPIGLHLAGSVVGTHDHVAPAEAATWAGYNLVVYALVPLAVFRRRYSADQLNLVSTDRRGDVRLILVVLVAESAIQIATLATVVGRLSTHQYLVGVPVTFLLYLAGTGLPIMVLVHALLVPRLLRLTGSTPATVVLGGVLYTALHAWDAWTVLTTPTDAVLSVVFLCFVYLAPGMMKTLLTVRTGNAWVHLWAYHALAPHTLIDSPHVVEIFRIR
ncbi:hypothetical protein J1G42_01105 [Cellulomonas sp. zg-ZUI222]|uniref:hypothetical protein n=1 Tax=Cellulomonas wangleii TaxID=2816956 RepID=UPI001A94A6E2|nr:hypothetical protein [Cellulomonas wangleii]MBO0919425.1 hypothetical protein [Cellulomonas wangleii]